MMEEKEIDYDNPPFEEISAVATENSSKEFDDQILKVSIESIKEYIKFNDYKITEYEKAKIILPYQCKIYNVDGIDYLYVICVSGFCNENIHRVSCYYRRYYFKDEKEQKKREAEERWKEEMELEDQNNEDNEIEDDNERPTFYFNVPKKEDK